MYEFAAIIVFILIVMWQQGYIGTDDSRQTTMQGHIRAFFNWLKNPSETYSSCRDCDGYRMNKSGTLVINPFIWPYSGASCVDDLYILNKDSGLDLGFNQGPLTHLNTPDHVELV